MTSDINKETQNPNLNQKTSEKPNSTGQKVVIGLLIFGLIFFGASLTLFLSKRNQNKQTKTSDVSSSSSISSISSSQEKMPDVDLVGLEILNQLKNVQGLDMGFIHSDYLTALNAKPPVKVQEKFKNLTKEELQKIGYQENKRLKDLISKPEKPEKTNWLSFPGYELEAPLVYASFQDMFKSDSEGIVDFNEPIEEDPNEVAKGNYESVPIQKLLKDGVVHLPFSTYPGEVGNSYIIGHSSNFSSVKSDYNRVFASIEQKTKVGDEFFVYDKDGRKLKFRVFEVLAIKEDDLGESYKSYPDKRVVTLQASILERVNGVLQPTKRWLTRGELVVE